MKPCVYTPTSSNGDEGRGLHGAWEDPWKHILKQIWEPSYGVFSQDYKGKPNW